MAKQTVTLQPGESQVVTFQYIPSVAKTYQVSVDGLSGSFRAALAPVDFVTLIGQITDAETGLPIVGVKARLGVYITDAYIKEDYTDSNGWYRLSPMETFSNYTMLFSKSGYESRFYAKIFLSDFTNQLSTQLLPL